MPPAARWLPAWCCVRGRSPVEDADPRLPAGARPLAVDGAAHALLDGTPPPDLAIASWPAEQRFRDLSAIAQAERLGLAVTRTRRCAGACWCWKGANCGRANSGRSACRPQADGSRAGQAGRARPWLGSTRCWPRLIQPGPTSRPHPLRRRCRSTAARRPAARGAVAAAHRSRAGPFGR